MNWLAGHSAPAPASEAICRVHADVLEHIRGLVFKRAPLCFDSDGGGSRSTLLRAKFGYDEASTNVAPFKSCKVSLPRCV